MARWQEALDALTDVYKFWRSDEGRRFAMGFMASVENSAGTDHETPPDAYRDMNRRLEVMAFNSDPIWIEPDMWRLVLAAAENWPGEGLEPSDLPTQAGFMLLPQPYLTEDVWGKQVSIRAVNWHPFRFEYPDEPPSAGLLLAFYHHTGDRDDYTGKERPGGPGPWLLSHIMPWTFSVHEDTGNKYAFYALGMSLQVCWRLMQQEVSISDERVAAGQFAKRAKRANLPEKRVTVVTLRRARPDLDYASNHTVEWTRQWVVSGHWRRQFYPSLGIHRLKWINPFVKGPPDMPLVIKKVRAFQWTR